MAGAYAGTQKELKTETVDLFLLGSAAAAVAALVLILRSNKAAQKIRGGTRKSSADKQGRATGSKPADAPRELLVAWVQFLRTDILEAVNTLHNRLNVIAHTATEIGAGDIAPEMKPALQRIKSEGDRAVKITTGLLRRVHAIAPDTMPKILFEYDGSKIPPSRILLIDNDDANRIVITKVFERLGQHVTAVANGFEAFATLETAEPDCIISDVKLPYLDGRTLFEQVEQQKPHLAARFVFVTGDYTNPTTVKFLHTTGQPFIGKPYEMESLLGAVAAILQDRIRDRSEAAV